MEVEPDDLRRLLINTEAHCHALPFAAFLIRSDVEHMILTIAGLRKSDGVGKAFIIPGFRNLISILCGNGDLLTPGIFIRLIVDTTDRVILFLCGANILHMKGILAYLEPIICNGLGFIANRQLNIIRTRFPVVAFGIILRVSAFIRCGNIAADGIQQALIRLQQARINDVSDHRRQVGVVLTVFLFQLTKIQFDGLFLNRQRVGGR